MHPRTALFVLAFPLRIGGHIKTALTMAKHLKERGWRVVVLPPESSDETREEFSRLGADVFVMAALARRGKLPSPVGAGAIADLARALQADLIHAWDFPSIGPAYAAAARTGIAFVFTYAGGPFIPREIPPHRIPTIVICQEQIRNFTKRHRLRPELLHSIPARIDLDQYRPDSVDPAFLSKYELPTSGFKVGMALRLRPDKEGWMQSVRAAAEAFAQRRCVIRIVVAGEGSTLQDLRCTAAEINARSSEGPVLQFIGPILSIDEMRQFYNYADVTVGSGQGILEAMACRKSVVILGNAGQAEALSPENVQEAAFYNFSGRHFLHRAQNATPLRETIESLRTDAGENRRLADFSFDYIRDHMDARHGAEQMLEVYEQAIQCPHPRWWHWGEWWWRVTVRRLSGTVARRL